MIPTIQADPVPLRPDEYGTLRVGESRIPLERILECHAQGYTPAAIVEAFDTLRLAHVHAVLAYYLNHQTEMNDYLRQQEERAEEVRNKIEAGQRGGPKREELLHRLKQQGNGSAAPGN